MSNDATHGKPRIGVQVHVTRAESRDAVLRARVRGRLGAYLSFRFVILVLATSAAWFAAWRAVQTTQAGDGPGPIIALGLFALVLTVIVALLAYELVVGQPIHAVATDVHAIGGRVPVAELDRFEIVNRGDQVDLRAVRTDGRRVDVALGVDAADARTLIGLLASVVGKGT